MPELSLSRFFYRSLTAKRLLIHHARFAHMHTANISFTEDI